ncbi:YesL family protein [Ruminococcus sp. 5_1_39BFAA]|uniref:YesL family protein n=1 Tax=Ruminococcus sp. 5_1_39BFAA TaxID=457412 RepID=UPI003562A6DD
MERFFNMDNKFFSFMSRVADLVILNLLCVVCCLPIITAGASITAMFYVTLKMARDEESYILRSFFKSFKENFKQATIINIIMLLAAVMLYIDLTISRNIEGTLGTVMVFVFMVILLLYLMLFTYIYPVLAKFYNTIRNTFTNAFLMSIRHLPYTFLMIVISVLPLAVFFIPNAQIQSTIIMLLVLLGFSTVAYINSRFLVKIFDNYIPKEEDEEQETAGELPDSGSSSL